MPTLTSLRFFAAALVVTNHYGAGLFEGAPAPLRNFVDNGHFALSFFFLLSGYILAHNYTGDDGQLVASRKSYFWSRVARIFPVLLATWLLTAPFALKPLFDNGWNAAQFLKAIRDGALSLTLLQSWIPQTSLAWNPPAWSLSVEVFLYLCFPYIVGPLFRLNRRQIVPGLLLCLIAATAAPAAYLLIGPDGLASPQPHSSGDWLLLVKHNPLLHLPSFVAGIFFNRLGRYKVEAIKRIPAYTADLLLLIFGAAMILPWGAGFLFVHNGILLPIIGLYMLVAYKKAPFSGCLRTKWLVFLGKTTFCMYLLQHPLICAFSHFVKPSDGTATLAFAGYFLGLLTASVAMHLWYEEPARRYVLRWSMRRSKA